MNFDSNLELTIRETVARGEFYLGGCPLKRHGGVYKGWLSPDGNGTGGVKAKASFTARRTCRAVAKAELSDPTIQYRMVEAQRIKATLGITG